MLGFVLREHNINNIILTSLNFVEQTAGERERQSWSILACEDMRFLAEAIVYISHLPKTWDANIM